MGSLTSSTLTGTAQEDAKASSFITTPPSLGV